MAEQILSQEEIDALLSAMDRGEVDLEGDNKKESVVEDYNLTSQNTMLRSQFYALEEVYDKFATLLDQSLTSTFQRSVEVAFTSTEMIKYGEFISAFSNPTSLNIFSMDPLLGSAMLAIESKLVFSLIDCMFGGDGKPLSQAREFTLIEQRMMKKFATEVLERLEEAWSIVLPVNIALKKTETKPEFAHLANPNELMIIIVFSIKSQEFTGSLHLCLSYLMLEPIKDKLSSTYLRESDMENAWSGQLTTLLQDTEVNIIAQLGKCRQTVRDILNLQLDDVVHLGTGPEDDILLTVDGVPKYHGFPGIIKGNRAVEITKLIRKNGG